MVVGGVPTSDSIAEEDDIAVCDLPNSAPTSPNLLEQSNEQPFDLLPGEILVANGKDLTDGWLYLSNYRLFICSIAPTCHCSFINCPIRLIESFEIKDNIYLCIQCKENRSFRLLFYTSERSHYWQQKLAETLAASTLLEDLFAIKYCHATSHSNNSMKFDYFHRDLTRLQLDQPPWRITDINRDYKLSPSYPKNCVVPANITNDDVNDAAKFRSHRRFPTIVWK